MIRFAILLLLFVTSIVIQSSANEILVGKAHHEKAALEAKEPIWGTIAFVHPNQLGLIVDQQVETVPLLPKTKVLIQQQMASPDALLPGMIALLSFDRDQAAPNLIEANIRY